jgi:hypothetical protein
MAAAKLALGGAVAGVVAVGLRQDTVLQAVLLGKDLVFVGQELRVPGFAAQIR